MLKTKYFPNIVPYMAYHIEAWSKKKTYKDKTGDIN